MKLLDLIKPLNIRYEDIISTSEFSVEEGVLPSAHADNPDVLDIAYDSRNVERGFLFVCIRGSAVDGHNYAKAAEEAGAVAIVSESVVSVKIPVILVPDTRKALALLSSQLFGNPATHELKILAITGTKGKTTTAHMIQSILEQAGHKTGMIGTIGVMYGGQIFQTENTTPASYEMQKYFRKMVDAGCEYCVIEASSIGLKDLRVYGFPIEIGIFTNFSEDHIGGVEHKDMQEYLESKRMLFRLCRQGVINIDDPSWEKITENRSCSLYTYGFDPSAMMHASSYQLLREPGLLGITFQVAGDLSFVAEVGIPGKFNAYNALAAISACHLLGITPEEMNLGLRQVKVKGRVEPVAVPGNYTLLIDYAHNAVSMESLLETLREYQPNRLICMFGAGGNRPKIRRYEMGEACGNLADLSIVTEDNSRYEAVLDIIEDIKVGLNKTTGEYITIPNRKDAIRYCIEHAQQGDLIVLAGKGHEDYQETQGVKHHLDEREVIASILG